MAATMRIGAPVGALPARRSVTTAVFKTGSNKSTSSKTLTTNDYIMSLPGISAPFNEPFFDPAGLSKTASVEDVRRWRESEVTHGRVAMLASLGFVVQEQLQDFKLALNFDGGISGPAIGHFQQVENVRPLFWEALVVAIGLAESFRVSRGWATPKGTGFNKLEEDYTPGDLGFDPLGLAPEDDAELKELKTKELNNGRLAMIAIAAFTAEELVSGQEIFEHLALRFEKEIILEVDELEKAAGLPITPLPDSLKAI